MSLYSVFFFSSRRRHTRFSRDWSSDVCSSDLFVDRLVGNLVQRSTHHRGGGFQVVAHVPRHAQARIARFILRFGSGLSRDGHVRSEERRVGKECRSRWARYYTKQKEAVWTILG